MEGSTGTPLFVIRANKTPGVFPTGSEVLNAQSHCRLSGVGIDGNDVATSVSVQGIRVIIDGFSALLNGNPYNLECWAGVSGLQVKDSQFKAANTGNAYMPSKCYNVRFIGDVITYAGKQPDGATNAFGILFGSEDITIADGVIEELNGYGLDFEGGSSVSVTGMFFDSNGRNGGAAIRVNGLRTASICGNHFKENDNRIPAAFRSAHVSFGGANNANISFCGNVYAPGTPDDELAHPNYVYDADSGTTLANASFYESPEPQVLGVLSPNAAALVSPAQVLPATRSFLTGLVLSNDASAPNDTVDVAPGTATDSTDVSVIQNTASCKIDLSTNGLKGLDTGSMSAATTYFFFVVEDLSPLTSPENTTSCIASTNLAPTFPATYGHGVYRLVGALYTIAGMPMALIRFHQDGDVFYLGNSVTDIQTGSTSICAAAISGPVSCPLSVPAGVLLRRVDRCRRPALRSRHSDGSSADRRLRRCFSRASTNSPRHPPHFRMRPAIR